MRRTDLPTVVRASAPMRLDFAGGWTDVPPFSSLEGGTVVNAAISLSVHVELVLGGAGITLTALDLDETVTYPNAAGLFTDGRLELHKAALRMFPVPGGCTLTTRSDAPPGSGLGGSGALDVALVAALARARGEHVTERELAEHGCYLEAVEARMAGGKQDQFAAAIGGCQRLAFRDPDVGIEPITLDPAFGRALAHQTVLCFTGRSRVSGRTIARVLGRYEQHDTAVRDALRSLKETADKMSEALRAADPARVGGLLTENWHHQQALDPEMRTAEMARLEHALASHALGGKAAGSGAGGCMFFLVTDPLAAAQSAREAGAQVLPVSWATVGAHAW